MIISTLENGKNISIDGDGINQDEAMELAKWLVDVWGHVHPHAEAVILYEVDVKGFSECPHYSPTEEGLREGLKIEGWE